MRYVESKGRGLCLAIVMALSACGGGGGGGGAAADGGASGSDPVACVATPTSVDWDALLSTNATKLSSYQLFQNPCNPTALPNDTGTPYDLTTPLFSDYATKYRFIFIPPGAHATYSAQEVMDFPVGTVITKTFSMPANTSQRGFDHETMLETRLLIRRSSGWVALPYVWNAAQNEAVLTVIGDEIPQTITHKGQPKSFTYQVPNRNQCVGCHQLETPPNSAVMTPIGPKARLLNRDYAYETGMQNQLQHLADAGLLMGLPDISTIPTIPSFDDSLDPLALSPQDLHDTAKGYLDVNCSHCHRVGGAATTSGLHLEYWRDYDTHRDEHGVCKQPVAYGGGALSYDVVTGDPAQSILHFRMNSRAAGDKMPEIGRDLVHEEGVALISSWITSLTTVACP